MDKKETTLIYNVRKKQIKFFEKNQKKVLTGRGKGGNIVKLPEMTGSKTAYVQGESSAEKL